MRVHINIFAHLDKRILTGKETSVSSKEGTGGGERGERKTSDLSLCVCVIFELFKKIFKLKGKSAFTEIFNSLRRNFL